jgi:hypothetical protein
MEMIIGRSHTPLNSSRTIKSVRRRDDNSRGKVQNVRGDSSADNEEIRAAHAAREWRQNHEREIPDEFISFLAIPNVSRDQTNIRRNADFVLAMLTHRGVTAKLLESPNGSPVVYGEILTPGATHTYVVYAHHDGQPVLANSKIREDSLPVSRSW